ncbi:UDP-N-acetylglucosamine 4,6-dehydratase [hydrothermal vent metagenome]|uniref:UDP-N-acetylglucosamine 4,6-dehydratase n=1 Tax=hydrothermal vent metagenome TaxID=652676 RepID=A0A3B1CU72_9ZZZZ
MKNRYVVVIFIHLLQVVLANYLAFILRFDSILLPPDFRRYLYYLPLLLLIRLVFYIQSGLYKDLWRYSGIRDLTRIVKSVTLGTIVFVLIVRYLIGDISYPRSIYALDWLLLIMISGGSRLLVRGLREYLQSETSGKKTLIIGAGDAGEMLVRDMKNNPGYAYEPVAFIDDDPYKKGLSIHGIPIFGPRSMIGEAIEKYKPEEILISMPSVNHKTINEIYELCKPFNLPIRILAGLSDILDCNVSVSQIKPLSLEDLLQREPVKTRIQSVEDYVEGKSVLITGAGGSIGSELCRQIIEYRPSVLVLLDRYENGLFQIDLELNKKKQGARMFPVVMDIGDTVSLEHLFSKHKPDIVFHAAAHKHVPLMENNPLEAVKNNIFGTKNLLEAAARHDTESFVMISTDKAVNPSNVMGASKRLAELLGINMNSNSSTKFTTVRFGNVLGSNGSVVHIFKEQLKQGGPLTVTHPGIKRFFMLIPEAVQLVLIAASAGKGGEIFVLDMGEPIRIVDFAENLIRLSGLIPYEDIKIEFTGLRPGDKLCEELFDESEKIMPTFHDKLRIALPQNVPSMVELSQHISRLRHIVESNSVDDVIPEIKKIVPGFKQP